MKKLKIKKLRKDQRGLTLIEIVIVIGLTSIVVAGITGAIMGVFNMDARTRNDMMAVYQVRQAGKLVSQDILQARTVDTEDDPATPEFELLTLTWITYNEEENKVQHMVIYTLKSVPSSELKILWRKQYHYEESTPILDRTDKVAEYIDLNQTSIEPSGTCSYPCGVYTFTVTATVGVGEQGEISETRVYQVKPRPGS